MAETDFAPLLEKARRGDQAAFAELIRGYEAEVRIISRVLVGPAMRPYLDSGDIMQSVHRTLLRGLRTDKLRIETPQQLIGLAVQMAKRKVAHQWRKLKRQQRRADPAGDSGSVPDFLASLVSPELDPARLAEVNETLRRLIEGLSVADRRLMELRLQGYGTAEAARLLKMDADMLRVRLSRLRQKLRDCGLFDDWLYGNPEDGPDIYGTVALRAAVSWIHGRAAQARAALTCAACAGRDLLALRAQHAHVPSSSRIGSPRGRMGMGRPLWSCKWCDGSMPKR